MKIAQRAYGEYRPIFPSNLSDIMPTRFENQFGIDNSGCRLSGNDEFPPFDATGMEKQLRVFDLDSWEFIPKSSR